MTVYTYYLHEDHKDVPSFEIQLFDAIDPALAHGKRLLKERTRYSSVEITSKDGQVANFTRDIF